ncbi:caspase domain-containing protein [Flammula alnicola]|nr:caspase domain-containing protein [Flammula alnicola]
MSTTAPRLFALVIGINEYKELQPKLSGAVPDANAMIEYLSSKTSTSRILSLQNAKATRSAIIEAFKTLERCEEIEKNDPIVIYFAGHGGEAQIQGHEELTQMLLPYDASPRTKNWEELPAVPGIPDYAIRKLLNDIAVEKGNNITVIFDCCHSGHGTRHEFPWLGTERRADIPVTITRESDERGSSLPEQYVGKDLWSHVLLSACRHDQSARESRSASSDGSIRGYFTAALLRAINEAGPTITYSELYKCLPALREQHPQCEGYNQNRLLFTLEERPSQFKIYYQNQIILMEGGTAHGVTGGKEEFVVSDGHSTFSLAIEKVHPFHSEMKSREEKPWPFENRIVTAFQKVPGETARLWLYVCPEANGRDVILPKLSDVQHLFSPANTKEEASLVLQLNAQGRVLFTITDRRVTDHGLSSLSRDIPLNGLESVIRAAQHYHWHLFRENTDLSLPNNTGLDRKVTLDFYKLKQTGPFATVVSADGDPVKKDIADKDVVVKVVADNKTWYGIELKNKTTVPLYPYLFFFDNSDMSIQPYFLPPSGANNEVDAPLRPKGSLTIGYSSTSTGKVHPGGSGPFVYECRPGQDVDVGFLKLFLSNQYIDLSTLLQGITMALAVEDDVRGLKLVKRVPRDKIWDAMVVTVVQEREK